MHTLLGLAAAACLVAPAALGDTLAVTASKDNTLYQSATGSLSNGIGDSFFVGNNGRNETRRGLVAFDLSSIPAGSTVTSVSLRLYMSRTQAGAKMVSLHRVLADWGEGASNASSNGGGGGAPAQPGDATWLHRFYNTVFWAAAGGDFAGSASASLSVSGNGSYTWLSTPALVSDVQGWVSTPGANFGWLVRGDESGPTTAKRFESRESGQASRRPTLTVTYTLPAGTGACCLAGGVCQILTSTQCAAQSGVFQGLGAPCSPNPCPQPTGACCLSGGVCSVLTSANCTAQGGVFQGAGTSCTPNPCPQPAGACCFNNASCQVLSPSQCTAQNGVYRGDGVACGAVVCPLVLTPFVDALPVPGVMQPIVGQPGGTGEYRVAITEFNQQLHRDLPPTRVWGYAGSFPGPTFEAGRDLPVTVTWVNDLRDAQNALRTTHYLPVDTCLHGPDTAGATARIVSHLHGGHVPADSDGYPEATILPGQSSSQYHYPNHQPPGTLWYHDHALGITRLNVYMGLAGFYLIRDPFEQGLGLPAGQNEIALAIQDRSFNPDGTLKYPAVWDEHFFGEFILVNGKVWPYLNVRQGKYRFRLLDGCSSRTLRLSLSNSAVFHQIGTDLGLLSAPVPLTELTISPGERADVVIDFAPYAPGTELILTNSAPAPFPGEPGVGVIPNVMKFIVTSQGGYTAPLPAALRPVTPIPEIQAAATREFTLRRIPGPCNTGQMWAINDLTFDDITEVPRLDTAEIWSFINRSGVTHPMHMHLVQFQILDRQPFAIINNQVTPTGPRVPPPAEEAGWKDTAKVNPSEILRVIARFEDYTGLYPYHCHILEHEDNEMMRQFRSTCYANCDGSLSSPALNVNDFVCFQNAFAAANPYADCDRSGTLNVNDFVCFQSRFAAGCP
jgi:spore coat protein A